MPSSMRRSWYAFRQRDANPPPDFFNQLLRTDNGVRVTNAPELFWIGEVTRRDMIQSFSLHDGVFLQHGEALRRRDETPAQIADHLPLACFVGRGFDRVIATRGWKKHRTLLASEQLERAAQVCGA